MRKVKIFLVILVALFLLEIPIFAYYNFLSPESNVNINILKQKYGCYLSEINIDATTGKLLSNDELLNNYTKVDEALIPASPEILDKIENEGYQYNPPVVNYYEKKDRSDEIKL